jgi:hypothetical protein
MAQRHAPRGPIKAKGDHMDARDHMDAPRCTATAKGSGVRCKRRPIPGGTVCVKHGGGAPQVQLAARERLLALQHPAIDALSWLITQRDFPSASYAASRDILDRTEGKPVETVNQQHSGGLVIRHEMPE